MRGLIAVVTGAVLALAACSSGSGGAPPRTNSRTTSLVSRTASSTSPPPVRQGQAFVNHGFKITVTKVELGHRQRLQSASDPQGNLTKPDNGQFVFVYLTVTNISPKPNEFGLGDNATLVDSAGRQFDESQDDLPDDVSQFGLRQQPGTTSKGYISFDVPLSVVGVRSVAIQPDPIIYEKNLPNMVLVSV